jgi:predicted enzyme related to lactoylglutathione lyase
MPPAVKLGTVTWVDLTVADAPEVRDFYQAVVGWSPREVDMGDYADFEMLPPDSADETGSAAALAPKAAAGICHARGGNAKLPPQWIIYVPVNDLARSLYLCEHLGGKVLHRLSAHYVLIQDPAGAVMMIYQPQA